MPTVNQCLILAAGNGSRIASVAGGVPKPLLPVCGVPLLEHVITASHEAGIEKFVIVAGYRADLIRSWLRDQTRHWLRSHSMDAVSITLIENPDYHKANGVSALAAKRELNQAFLLLMSDHIFEPKTAQALLLQPIADDEVILAVDSKIGRIFDLDDATKVRCEGNRIIEIGKDLSQYNALDTGMFLCSPALFHRLESARKNGDCSLSEGMRELAKDGKLRAFDIGDGRWQDVDSPQALAHAEEIFDQEFCGNPATERLVSV